MPTVEVEVYHELWEFDTDTFPPLSLLTFPTMVGFCHGGNVLGNHHHHHHHRRHNYCIEIT